MFWLPIVVVGRVVPCHFATWALVISAHNPPVALQCYQTQGVRTPWEGKRRQRVAKGLGVIIEAENRQVWTFVGPCSICPHSFSGSAFCSWFWQFLSSFGLPQQAHMITSVDHLKTMDPGWINATCFTFVRRWCPFLGLNCFSQNCFRTDAMEERNVCNTNFEKSCELVEVEIVLEFCFDFDNTSRWELF